MHYFLRCSKCGAPAADTVRICPYCGFATGFDGARGAGRATADGGYVIGAGDALSIGGAEARECPFCGDRAPAGVKHCPSCSAKLVIERLIFATLRTERGGSLTVGSGGSVRILGRSKQAIHEASRKNDVGAIKACILEGYDPDFPDEHDARPLHYAVHTRATNAIRHLLSVGADIDAADRDQRRPLHLAAERGDVTISDLLVACGARKDVRDRRNRTPADTATAHRHLDLAERLR